MAIRRTPNCTPPIDLEYCRGEGDVLTPLRMRDRNTMQWYSVSESDPEYQDAIHDPTRVEAENTAIVSRDADFTLAANAVLSAYESLRLSRMDVDGTIMITLRAFDPTAVDTDLVAAIQALIDSLSLTTPIQVVL